MGLSILYSQLPLTTLRRVILALVLFFILSPTMNADGLARRKQWADERPARIRACMRRLLARLAAPPQSALGALLYFQVPVSQSN